MTCAVVGCTSEHAPLYERCYVPGETGWYDPSAYDEVTMEVARYPVCLPCHTRLLNGEALELDEAARLSPEGGEM